MFKFTRLRWAGLPAEVTSALTILGLKEGASSADVRECYLKLARTHHPDLQGGDDSKMKVINIAYETLQLHGTSAPERAAGAGSSTSQQEKDQQPSTPWYDTSEFGTSSRRHTSTSDKFKKKGRRMADMIDDEFDTWNTKSDNDWSFAVNDVSPDEASLPSNNPLSQSRFYTNDEDVELFRLLRSGATIPQAARALNKPATFVSKRVHNAQFKLRAQHILRQEKRGERASPHPLANGGAGVTVRTPKRKVVSPTDKWDRYHEDNGRDIRSINGSQVLSAMSQNYQGYHRLHKPM
jgi:hypothetical protein